MSDQYNQVQRRSRDRIKAYAWGTITAALFVPALFLINGHYGEAVVGAVIGFPIAAITYRKVASNVDEFEYCERCGRQGCDGPPCQYH